MKLELGRKLGTEPGIGVSLELYIRLGIRFGAIHVAGNRSGRWQGWG